MPSRTAISRAAARRSCLRRVLLRGELARLQAIVRGDERRAFERETERAFERAVERLVVGTELLKSAISTETGRARPARRDRARATTSAPSSAEHAERRRQRQPPRQRAAPSGAACRPRPARRSRRRAPRSSAYRASGSGWMHRVMMRSSASGIVGSIVRGGGGASRMREVELGERAVGARGPRPAEQQVVEDQAEGVEVGALIDRLRPRLFGRHVLDRADHGCRARSGRRRRPPAARHRPGRRPPVARLVIERAMPKSMISGIVVVGRP